jgi:hypothetical protein
MKMKREIFSRGVRMTHTFDELIDRQDPLATQTFDLERPMRPDALSKIAPTGPCTSQNYGLHNYRPDSSPVVKPNGQCARSDGPAPDYAMDLAMPIPAGTKRRLGPLKTDK